MPKTITKPPQPKYITLAETMRRQIRSGSLKPGDRLPSQAELKARYGISQATMERLHAHLELDGLIVRKQGLGTFVAERPRRERTGIVGITGLGFLKDLGSFYWTHILEGIRSEATPAELQILLIDTDQQSQSLSKVDGLFITSPDEPSCVAPEPGLPYVELITALEAHDGVVADDAMGGRLLTEHLLSLGHRRIAMLTTLNYEPAERRLSGYKAALRAAGIEPDSRWVREIGDLWPEFVDNGRLQMNKWLSEDWDELGCTAILAYNDPTAVGIIDALTDRGISVPDEVSVTGYDATGLYDYMKPLLTSVDVPLEEIGRRGMKLLLNRLNGNDGPYERIMVPVTVRPGDSTAPVSTVIDKLSSKS
ncbi:MAG TPA: GntR family transcriptional regulator [Capsulimonadaceae bacterium]|jgi:GntR family transcriptional regulator of arabinose operon